MASFAEEFPQEAGLPEPSGRMPARAGVHHHLGGSLARRNVNRQFGVGRAPRAGYGGHCTGSRKLGHTGGP